MQLSKIADGHTSSETLQMHELSEGMQPAAKFTRDQNVVRKEEYFSNATKISQDLKWPGTLGKWCRWGRG